MNHITDELLNSYLDGDTASSVSSGISAHIHICESCRTRLDELKEIHHLLYKLPLAPAPERTEDQILKILLSNSYESLRMPLFVKVILTIFAGLIIFFIGYAFSQAGVPSVSPASPGILKPALKNYSLYISNFFSGIISPKYYSTFLFSLMAMLSMSLYFLFEKIRSLRYIK